MEPEDVKRSAVPTRAMQSTTLRAARARLRAMSDVDVLAAMREGDDLAWYEFDRRFRPRLERFAQMIGVPDAQWNECIDEVLEDAALHFAFGTGVAPQSLSSYLVRSVRNRALNLVRRDRRDALISDVSRELLPRTEGVPAEDESRQRGATDRAAAALRATLTPEEEMILGWVGESVPYRRIAEWLGISYEATAKRIARLGARLRARLTEYAHQCDPSDRAVIERWMSNNGSDNT